MRRISRASIGFLIGVAFCCIALGDYRYHAAQMRVTKDYSLPGDNFDQKTMDTIRNALIQYNVAGTPQDHEVYMITGGLGVANPRLMGWDSGGNMTFGGNYGDSWIYTFQETAESPAKWYMAPEGKGMMWTNGPQPGMKPVPWVLKHTKLGQPYYEWDMIGYQTTQFYFQKGSTYIVLKDDYTQDKPAPAFPVGLMNHLVPVENPVTKK